MLVVYWMTNDPVTVEPDTPMFQALRLMEKHGLRRLPVIKKREVVGIVTAEDIKAASPSQASLLSTKEIPYMLQQVRVKEIMTPDPVTVMAHATIEEAAELMMDHKVGCLPVKGEEGLAGIITESDVFRALVSLGGVKRGGLQFALELSDEPGSIKRAADVIRFYGGSLVSILTSYDHVPEGRRRVYIRCRNLNRRLLEDAKQQLARAGDLIYVLDNHRKLKEMFVSPEWVLALQAVRRQEEA